jgi:hypothetical protein
LHFLLDDLAIAQIFIFFIFIVFFPSFDKCMNVHDLIVMGLRLLSLEYALLFDTFVFGKGKMLA